MRANAAKKINRYRIRDGEWGSSPADGANGAFDIPYNFHPNGVILLVLASDGSGWKESGLPGDPWEHVSVSLAGRCPAWEEMDFVKRIFWRDDETVMQLHVPRDDHISFHPTCLHLWKPVGVEIPRPPSLTVA